MGPECKSSPPSKRSSSGAKGGTAPCPKCCGCVTGLSIEDVKLFTSTPPFGGKYGTDVANGHSFVVYIDMSFCPGTSVATFSDCALEWWEKTNVPYIHAHNAQKKNTWTDLYALIYDSPTFDPWNDRVVLCPGGGDLSVRIEDIPCLGTAPGINITRTLEFRIIVRSGGCGCAKGCLMVRAKQVLVMMNGELVKEKCSFQIL
jgi:hypothetical protein